jgi:tRNA pseudouridine32 synthase/23S rRNA pseudouridine746 synthase
MHSQQTCFTPFIQSIESDTLPQRFTFPFCYEPHPLCILASTELQSQLNENSHLKLEFQQHGKMFGVLIVKNLQGDVGYLSAFSGKKLTSEHHINFVPPVVDLEDQADFFYAEKTTINQLNYELEVLLNNPEIKAHERTIAELFAEQNKQLEQHRDVMALNRQTRKAKRSQINAELSGEALAQQLNQLAKESVDDKNQLKALKQNWHDKITHIEQQLNTIMGEINTIKSTRSRLSTRLQKKLFKQYRLLNSAGVEKDVMELFQHATHPIPPAGTGDCAAPKLLQYAFKHKLTPLAMAEFWWGRAPKSEIRQHKNFYAACSGKCQPILPHMLEGIALDKNPLLVNPALGKKLAIIYQDDDMVIVDKPSEFLSVPGKYIEDSVYLRIKQQFPQATGTLIVHRLDMSTSGVMVLALTKRAQKNIQQQFINRTIKKRYVALLEGKLAGNFEGVFEGEINLPLRGDLEDRPRQLVCFEQGKQAKTHWQLIKSTAGKSKLYLYPETGRTHQLRVHCAHQQGLNMPILGDDLYGYDLYENNGNKKHQRLHLHAQRLTLSHPVTKEVMTFEVDEGF